MKKIMVLSAMLVFLFSAAWAETVEMKQVGLRFNVPAGFKKVRDVSNNNMAQMMFCVGGLGSGGRNITVTVYNRRYSEPAEVAQADMDARKKDPLYQKVTPIKVKGTDAAVFYKYNAKQSGAMLFQASLYTKLHYIGIEFGSTPQDAAAFEKIVMEFMKSVEMR